MEHICSYCGKRFDAGYQLGAHKSSCRQNPRISEFYSKRARRVERFQCTLECIRCGSQFTITVTQNALDKKKHVKYCSRACAMIRQPVPAAKRKKRERKLYVSECKVCHSIIKQYGHPGTICSKACRSKQLSIALKGKCGGYRTQSGTSKFHGSWYQSHWMDSSWELALAKRLDTLGIAWERGKRTLPYIDETGRQRTYHPDFYLPKYDFYLEVKGYWLPGVKHKIMNAILRNNVRIDVLASLDEIESYDIAK